MKPLPTWRENNEEVKRRLNAIFDIKDFVPRARAMDAFAGQIADILTGRRDALPRQRSKAK